jgi:hypothetical protein
MPDLRGRVQEAVPAGECKRMTRSASDSPAARALRDAGYVKLPGWWVKQSDFELIEYMARQRLPEIETIKRRANNGWPETYNP